MEDIDAYAAVSHALAQSIVTKVTAMVLDAEDDRLNVAVKKMDLVEPAVKAASQANANELSELKKMVAGLAKKIDLNSKKVRDCLFRLLRVCGGHLSLTRPLLETFLVGFVQAGGKKSGADKKKKEKGRRARPPPPESKRPRRRCRQSRQGQGQGQRQGRRPRCEVKAAGRQEEGCKK